MSYNNSSPLIDHPLQNRAPRVVRVIAVRPGGGGGGGGEVATSMRSQVCGDGHAFHPTTMLSKTRRISLIKSSVASMKPLRYRGRLVVSDLPAVGMRKVSELIS